MSNENDKPDPLDDVKKGFGLLFRAAKTAVEKLPTHGVENVVISGAREVGRAVENVAHTIEKEVFGRAKDGDAKQDAPEKDDATAKAKPADEPKKPDDAPPPPAGPRVDPT